MSIHHENGMRVDERCEACVSVRACVFNEDEKRNINKY